MKRDEMIKYSAELVVKNNPDEAVKLLINYEKVNNQLIHENNILRDEILDLNEIIDKAIKYMEHYIEVEDASINERIKIEFKCVIDILRGEK